MTDIGVQRGYAALRPRLSTGTTWLLATLASRRVQLLVALLFVLGAGIRLYQADSAPLDFHAARQYRSLIIARDLFYDTVAGVPEWQRQVATASAEKQGMLEPPIMELLAAAAYSLLGGEQLWIPRLLSSAAWLMGAGFLYSIIRRLADPTAAIFGVAFYLLLPFGVAASRSFQPDPLMVSLVLASLWAILRYDEAPTTGRLVAAAIVASLAFTSQPRTVPVIAATFVLLLVYRRGVWTVVRDWSFAVFVLVSGLLPAGVYGYGILTGTFRTDIAEAILLPQLWVSPFLWRGWLTNIQATVGLVAFFGALLGVLVLRPRRPRALALGLWIGYLGFGLVFDYAVATHDYYHLQLVPIVAITASPVVALVLTRVMRGQPTAGQLAIAAILMVAVLAALVDARGRIANPDWRAEVAVKEQIGAAVGHSARTIFLSADYGTPLEYHGLVAGFPWPLASDLEWEALAGVSALGAEERFATWFASRRPEFFIVEDFSELELQPDLERFLDARFTLLARTEQFAIYDLRPAAGS